MSISDGFDQATETLTREKKFIDNLKKIKPTELTNLYLMKSKETEYKSKTIKKLSEENQDLNNEYSKSKR